MSTFSYEKITGKIKVKTGLHIGGNKEGIHIGGLDASVIKDREGFPYVPGSSLKGKLRSLLEFHQGKVDPNGRAHGCNDGDCPVCRIFGRAANENPPSGENWTTRLIVRDAFLSEEFKKKYKSNKQDLFEEKVETAIDRQTGTAKHGLRTRERTISGIEFDLDMTYKIFDEKDKKNIELVKKAIELLNNDYLGGSGSRGYGAVDITFEFQTVSGK